MFAKLAYDKGLTVNRFVTMRFFILMACSYVFGKIFRKTSFDLRKYKSKVVLMTFFRAALSLVSKIM